VHFSKIIEVPLNELDVEPVSGLLRNAALRVKVSPCICSCLGIS